DFTTRVRMPLVRIERGQQIVEITRARIEINLGGELRDQAIDLLDMLLHERGRVGVQILDLAGRWSGRKDLRNEVTHLLAVIGGIFPTAQRVEPQVEFPL